MDVRNQSADLIANNQSQVEIFMLKIDHFEEIFDWLSLNDLVVLAQTCKRMQCIVGYYTKTNYAGIKPQFDCNGISFQYMRQSIKMDVLSKYLKRLVFFYFDDLDWWRKSQKMIPHMKADQFASLTEMVIKNMSKFNDVGISRVKEILGQLKTLRLNNPYFVEGRHGDDLYSAFLCHCTSIKRLSISLGRHYASADNNWLQQKYPTLEHFELTTYEGVRINELRIFFKENAKIQSFASNIDLILANKDIFEIIEVKWEILSIHFYDDKQVGLNEIWNLLNRQYERGIFKELHLYFECDFNQKTVKQIQLCNGLIKLHIWGIEFVNSICLENQVDLSVLTGLKQLCISDIHLITNMKTVAEKLFNLEFIEFWEGNFNNILLFIRHAPKLTKIIVFTMRNSDHFHKYCTQLNEERSKLMNARKVIIYVEESIYLRMKWTKQTCWNLIEIKRGTSYDALNHSFDYQNSFYT